MTPYEQKLAEKQEEITQGIFGFPFKRLVGYKQYDVTSLAIRQIQREAEAAKKALIDATMTTGTVRDYLKQNGYAE